MKAQSERHGKSKHDELVINRSPRSQEKCKCVQFFTCYSRADRDVVDGGAWVEALQQMLSVDRLKVPGCSGWAHQKVNLIVAGQLSCYGTVRDSRPRITWLRNEGEARTAHCTRKNKSCRHRHNRAQRIEHLNRVQRKVSRSGK